MACFVKIVILLTVNLLMVSGYQPPFPVDIKDSNGNAIQIHNRWNCYALFVKDVVCTDSGQYVAPLTYLYGIKPMVFQNNHNCSKNNPSVLPKECCEPESNDCIFGSTKDIIQVWENCGYKSHCPSLTGERTSIKEGEDHTCSKEFITENDISTSQYSYLMYACLPEKMEVNFDGGNGKGKALLLKATETSFNTGIKLQCHINTDNNGVIVQFVDVRLCYENNGVCDQTLTFYKNGKAAKPLNTGSKFGLEPWQSSPGQANVTITFERQSPTTKFYILLYITSFKKGTSDMEIKCDQPIPFERIIG